jgi:alpha-ketoglutarate-dependent taurine dioxygenase
MFATINLLTNPYDLDNDDDYLRWREHKLASSIEDTSELIVEIKNPCALTKAEHAELLDRCRRSNMAIYASKSLEGNSGILREFARQFGLEHLDANWLADEDGISEIKVNDNGTRQAYIPYTDRAIKWHTDGYYNPLDRQVRSFVLHCVQQAKQGGENRLMDHEIAYLMLRDENPDYIRALSEPDAMTIPERTDEYSIARGAQTGPVFSVDPVSGQLHMRYTARTRSIEWKQDTVTLAAVSALEKLLATATDHIYTIGLEPGMGLLCNNVMHDRAAFVDNEAAPRLLFRARYYERIKLD